MVAEIVKNAQGQSQLVVTVPLYGTPVDSSTGKTKLVASSGSWQPTTVQLNGKVVSVMIHAAIPNK